MPAGDVWGNRWLSSWNGHWRQAEEIIPEPEAETRPLGVSPWIEFDEPESRESKRERIRRDRERLGIIAPPEAAEATPASEAPSTRPRPNAAPTAPPASPQSGDVISLETIRAIRAAQDAAREALNAEAQAIADARSRQIRQRMALLLLAAEA